MDWTASMQQTYSFYKVDPYTWSDVSPIEHVLTCNIERDSSSETLQSATIECTDDLDEQYIRVYLEVSQNDEDLRVCLGTFLVQTPSISFDGKVKSISLDAYSPLIELNEKYPPIGYTLKKQNSIMDNINAVCEENMRAPVTYGSNTTTLPSDYIANTDDTWLTYVETLLSVIDYSFDLDDQSRVIFSPVQDFNSLSPVWVYTDDNSSILYPDITIERDLYGIPNVLEVIYSGSDGSYYYSKIVNDDPDSPVSTVNRGREIMQRITDPEISGTPDADIVEEYAKRLLKSYSTIEFTVSYKHGYCPVRVGDAVLLNYTRAGLVDVKALVVSQSITCESGCPVSETAKFTKTYWSGI